MPLIMTAPLDVPSTISFARRRRGCPLKKIDVSAQTGDGGIALIHQQVNKMGFVWHERKTDAGIDGEIELRNPELAKRRAHKRRALLEATDMELEKIRDRVARGALVGEAAIGLRVGRVINKYKVGKHFALQISSHALAYHILEDQVAAEAALDGIYVIRT